MISRALLVKPLARHLQSYPDIYDVNATCIEARPYHQPSQTLSRMPVWSLTAMAPWHVAALNECMPSVQAAMLRCQGLGASVAMYTAQTHTSPPHVLSRLGNPLHSVEIDAMRCCCSRRCIYQSQCPPRHVMHRWRWISATWRRCCRASWPMRSTCSASPTPHMVRKGPPKRQCRHLSTGALCDACGDMTRDKGFSNEQQCAWR